MSRRGNRRRPAYEYREKPGVWPPFMYGDHEVQLLGTSEIHRSWFGQGGCYADDVQKALDDMYCELGYDGFNKRIVDVHTYQLPNGTVPQFVVKRQPGQRVQYGVFKEHRAKNPDLSPFVVPERHKAFPRTNLVTVEVVGNAEALKLVRAYGGEEAPPLPWQQSVSHSGDAFDSFKFWSDHAFFASDRTVDLATLTTQSPRWARDIERLRVS